MAIYLGKFVRGGSAVTEVLITSSVLILALLVLRKLFRRSISRRVQYALWALVLVRLLVPVNLPAMDFSVLTAATPVEQTVTQNIAAQPIYVPVAQAPLEEHPAAAIDLAPRQADTFMGESVWVAQTEQQTAVQYKRISTQTVLSWVWITGSAILGAFLLLVNVRFWLWLRKARKPYEIDDCKLPVYLVKTGLPSPCLFGLFRPAVYLTPAVLESEERLRHVLAHELTHARHLDHLWTFLRGVCLVVYWFDPLVWAAYAAAKKDCELACDEGALAKLEEEDRIPYGETLVSLIPVRHTVNPMLATTAMTTGKKHLKDRVSRIAQKPRQLVAAVAAIAVLTVAISACTFTGSDSGKVVICFDIGDNDTTGSYQTAITGFLNWIDDCHKYLDLNISSEDIEVVMIPGAEAELSQRSAALLRVRAEIMAGKGPDVFISTTFSDGRSELSPMEGGRLFSYVENVRESGIFLPLDEDLSTLTLTDVNDLIPQVLAGGKNRDGEQVLLPLTFTVPGTVFSGKDAPEYNFEGTSWNDVISGDDPVLAEQTVWPMNFALLNGERIRVGIHDSGLFCIYPQTADFETGKLHFSEDELLIMVKDSLNGYHRTMEHEMTQPCASLYFSPWSVCNYYGGLYLPDNETHFTFIPLRNLEGGSTAVVGAYCAVNAYTEQREKALAVIDALMCREYQQGGSLYRHFSGMPTNRELGSIENPYLQYMKLSPKQFENWQRVCADINIVRFPSALDAELDSMIKDIEDTMLTVYSPYNPDYIVRDGQFIYESIADEELEEIVSKHYQQIQHLLDES